MRLLDGTYTRTQTDPITFPQDAEFVVSEDGQSILWTDGRVYRFDGEQYETDPGGHAIIFHPDGMYLEVHTSPISYARGTLGPGVE